jgi:hypothetical protein
MSKGNYLIRYVCTSKNDKPRKETCHKLSHLVMVTGDCDVICTMSRDVKTEENEYRVSVL